MIKYGIYIINFDDYKSIGTCWIALCMNSENVTYYDSLGVEQKKLEDSFEIKLL